MVMALRSQIFCRDNRFASSWSPEFGLFPGRSSADLRRSHGRLPIAPVAPSLVYGHPLAEKNCWRPLRTHAPFLSTVVARALTCSTMSRYERQSILQSPGSGNDFLLSNFMYGFTFKQLLEVL